MSSKLQEGNAHPQKKKSHKLWIWIAAILLIILIVMFFTRPEKAKHEEKIRALAMEVVNEKADEQNALTRSIVNTISPYVVDKAVEMFVELDDYYFFNIGRIKFKDTDQPISIGLFNHAFTLAGKETVIKKLEETSAAKKLKKEEDKKNKKELKAKQKEEKKALKARQREEKKVLKAKQKEEKKALKKQGKNHARER